MNTTAIEWAHCFGPGSGFTWNPIVGCTYGCSYCYARRIAKRQRQNCELCYGFTPHLHWERLKQPLCRRKPTGIFLGSMTDLYGPEVPQGWRDRIWQTCADTPQHRYFVLTKQPQNMRDDPPANVLLGFTAEDQSRLVKRLRDIDDMPRRRPIMVSLEPLLDDVYLSTGLLWYDSWVIVGGMTGQGLHESVSFPFMDRVNSIVDDCAALSIACFVKDSAQGLGGLPRQWPEWITSVVTP